MTGIAETVDRPSAWVRRFVPLIRAGGLVLDLAAGRGRHAQLLLEGGFTVRAVDRDVSALRRLAGPRCEVKEIDLESATGWQLGDGYDGIVVTNYLHRPLLPALASAVARDGILIYETFAHGNERLGRPRNRDFGGSTSTPAQATIGPTTSSREPRSSTFHRSASR